MSFGILRDTNSEYRDIVVEVQKTKRNRGEIRLKAILRFRETEEAVPGIKPLYKTIKTEKLVSTTTDAMVWQLCDRYRESCADHGGAELEAQINAALMECNNGIMSYGFKFLPSWTSPVTNLSALTYFKNRVLKEVLPFLSGEKEFLPSDRDAIESAIYESVRRKARSVNDYTAQATTNSHLAASDAILQYLYNRFPYMQRIRLASPEGATGTPSPEMPKFIPLKVYRNFAKILQEKVAEKPELVFGAVHVLYGARIAEAAARRPEDIMFFKTYATSRIFSQERNGQRDPHLKNKYSHRIAVIGYFGAALLSACVNQLADGLPGPECSLSRASVLSSTIREWLLQAGMKDGTLEELEQKMRDDGECGNSDDFTAYILRRSFAGLARNVMGLSLREVDYLLGHCDYEDENLFDDFRLEETQASVAAAMERVIFSESLTLNPDVVARKLKDGTMDRELRFSRLRYVNAGNTELEVDISVDSLEDGEDILLCTYSPAKLTSSRRVQDPGSKNRLLIGDTRADGRAEK